MKNRRIVALVSIVLTSLFFLNSCSSAVKDNEEIEYAIEGQTVNGFEDGTYCADVSYYNPNTRTSSDYTLEVEVESNEVVQINFGNGGWLDSDHMSPEVLNNEGNCTITSDRNYEYAIKITGKDCGYSDDINRETDVDLPRYTFAECTQMLSMSQEEINDCLSSNYSESDMLSESGFSILEEYINNIRAIHEQYQREVGAINQKQNKMQNEIKNGYIQSIKRFSAYGNTNQIIVISKNGVNYTLEVRGSQECTMGTAQFNENSNDWQMVYIKQYPDVDHWSGHYMRIIN